MFGKSSKKYGVNLESRWIKHADIWWKSATNTWQKHNCDLNSNYSNYEYRRAQYKLLIQCMPHIHNTILTGYQNYDYYFYN